MCVRVCVLSVVPLPLLHRHSHCSARHRHLPRAFLLSAFLACPNVREWHKRAYARSEAGCRPEASVSQINRGGKRRRKTRDEHPLAHKRHHDTAFKRHLSSHEICRRNHANRDTAWARAGRLSFLRPRVGVGEHEFELHRFCQVRRHSTVRVFDGRGGACV